MASTRAAKGSAETPSARERILDTAYELFSRHGVRAVGVDRIVETSGVAKMSLYRHFPSKDDLVAAYLGLRAEQERAAITAQRAELGNDAAAVLLWYADMVGQAVASPEFRGCPFINAAAELPAKSHPGRAIIGEHRAWLISQAAELLSVLHVVDADAKAEQLMMLRDGAMVSGYLSRTPEHVSATLVAGARAIMGRPAERTLS
jgi:AcrR family transcriptional regulator